MKQPINKFLAARFGFACLLASPFAESSIAAEEQRPNILFIAVDDLRPELGCYGKDAIKSPHIDKLASQGIVFSNAYCNVPVCGASRASLMTGIRPTRTRFVNYLTRVEEDTPGAVTMAGHFKAQGYTTISLGKILHHQDDRQEDWSEGPWRAPYNRIDGEEVWQDYVSKENADVVREQENRFGWPYEEADVPDNTYADGKVAERAIKTIGQLAASGKPFFLGVGFFKPHLPFVAPKKYWNLYNVAHFDLPDNYYRSKNAPDAAFHNFGELRAYYGVPKEGPVSDALAKKMIHGYHACVSYTDTLIGRVLDALDEHGLAGNTIIVLWGDHGWNLGEHTLWCKHCNFNTSLRIPLIVKAPGMSRGEKAPGLVETVDIFPTLCDLTGVPQPDQLHGSSFAPLLRNPVSPGKEAVFCQWFSGATIKTPRHAYTEWTNDDGELTARMLYDHEKDPGENFSIAELSENEGLVAQMSEILRRKNREFSAK